MTLTKDHIIGSLQSGLGLSRFGSTRCLESVLELIKTSLANGDDVLISGFGKFTVHQKAARRGRNPATGEALPLPPRRVVTFKCSTVMKGRMNGKGD
jgi:integration host factor subunit alpha